MSADTVQWTRVDAWVAARAAPPAARVRPFPQCLPV